MWECQKCHERHAESDAVCWNCGTTQTGVEDPAFRTADQIDPTTLEPRTAQPVEAIVDRTVSPPLLDVPREDQENYEFSPAQKAVIANLATNMNIVGVVSICGGVLLGLMGCVLFTQGNVTAWVQGAVALIVGGLTGQAAGAFRQIVYSRGDDISHLMTALEALRNLYRLQVILLGLAVVVGLVALSALLGSPP